MEYQGKPVRKDNKVKYEYHEDKEINDHTQTKAKEFKTEVKADEGLIKQ